MKISVFGTGYVGLATGVCFSEMGNDVICVDKDSGKLARLQEGFSPIFEPGLEELIRSNLRAGRLQFSEDSSKAVLESEILVIAVGTPVNSQTGTDLTQVFAVTELIGRHMQSYKAIVTKSTVPVGTASKIKKVIEEQLAERQLNLEFDVISNPEFLREGTAVEDCLRPSRVVVGCDTPRAGNLMSRLYEPFLKNGNPHLEMDPASAEMTKFAANAMLAAKVTLMNEFSRLCEKSGADIEKIRRGVGTDPRIGPQFLFAGVGFGGSCLPKDLESLIQQGHEFGEKLEVLEAVQKANAEQRHRFLKRILRWLDSSEKNPVLALWGVSFKAGTDDIREAPSLDLIRSLLELGVRLHVHDPAAGSKLLEQFGSESGIQVFENQYEALERASALVILTEWKSFKEPDFRKIRRLLKNPVIFDGRNLFSVEVMKENGFQYHSVGRISVL